MTPIKRRSVEECRIRKHCATLCYQFVAFRILGAAIGLESASLRSVDRLGRAGAWELQLRVLILLASGRGGY